MLCYKQIKLNIFILMIALVLVVGAGTSLAIDAPEGWVITRLGDSTVRERDPQISGSYVVWSGWDGSDWEIFLYDGMTTTQLTDNSLDEYLPQVSANHVVWDGCTIAGDHDSREIFLYNIDTGVTTRLTDNSYTDFGPQISGSNLVWMGGEHWVAREIFLYNIDSAVTTQVTDNDYQDEFPQISGSNVVWMGKHRGGSPDPEEIFLYNIDSGVTTQLTDNMLRDRYPQISGSNVVWMGYEIFLYNIETGVTTELTNNNCADLDPQISGSYVVWEQLLAGFDRDICLYNIDTGVTTQLTYNDRAYMPQISGSNIAWFTYRGIFYYNIDTGVTTQLSVIDPHSLEREGGHQIYASNVVWLRIYDDAPRFPPSYTTEILLARPDPVEATEKVIEDLNDIVVSYPGTDLADKVEDAVAKLQTALTELAKTPPDNQAAVGCIEGAVGDLEAAVQDGLLDVAQGTQLMDRLACIARKLATDALDKAIAQGGDPTTIAEAEQALAEGDTLRSSGLSGNYWDFKNAVNKYKDALAKAEGAL